MMVIKADFGTEPVPSTRERLSYIRQMLGELTHVARAEKADLLIYLLEMAFTEANDLLADTGRESEVERHQTTGMPMKPSGKI